MSGVCVRAVRACVWRCVGTDVRTRVRRYVSDAFPSGRPASVASSRCVRNPFRSILAIDVTDGREIQGVSLDPSKYVCVALVLKR